VRLSLRVLILGVALVTATHCGTDGSNAIPDTTPPADTGIDGVVVPDTSDSDSTDAPSGRDTNVPNPDTKPNVDVPCSPSCEGKACGDDGCGGSCGGCGLFEECDGDSQCTAVIQCIEATNTLTGDCPSNETCLCVGCVTNGTCDVFEDDCICPDCATGDYCSGDLACIDDGQCDPYNEGCQCADCSAQPLCNCTPGCDGKLCGDDGCLGSCGGCDNGQVCNDDQTACVECVPICEGKTCGNDGCGGSCGVCTDGKGCGAESHCIDVTIGESCANPKVISPLPYTDNADSSAQEDSNHDFGACAQETEAATGHLVPDVAYVFTPEKSGQYVLSVVPVPSTEPTPPDGLEPEVKDVFFPTLIYVSTECGWPVGAAPTNAECTGVSDDLWGSGEGASWNVELVAETTYFIILDGAVPGFDQGPYTFKMDAVCLPDCTNKNCGDDGCGGACGSCPPEQACDEDGLCVIPLNQEGNNCENPFIVNPANGLPWSATGDTSGATNTQSYGYGECPGTDSGAGLWGRDTLYEFTPDKAGVYTVTVDSSFDATLYVLKKCTESKICIAGADTVDASGTESVAIALNAAETVSIVVDGAVFGDVSGAYTLSISTPCIPNCDGKACGDNGCGGACGTCPDGALCDGAGACADVSAASGNTCKNPFVVDASALPYKEPNDTSSQVTSNNYAGSFGSCPGLFEDTGKTSGDHAYSFTPTNSGAYTVSLESAHDAALYVATDCENITQSCVVGDDGLESDTLALNATAGTTYFIIVDGYAGANGPYTLNVAVCAPACDGKTCGPDGCGSTCGTCTGDDTCSQDGQCVAKTCKGFCGAQSAAGCYCDTTCFALGDCCPDVCDTCVDQFPGNPADCKP
jgi:hypothetical protein